MSASDSQGSKPSVKITRKSAGNYSIIVNGIHRGDITRRADGWWSANFCNTHGEYGAAITGPTKREIVRACMHNSTWE